MTRPRDPKTGRFVRADKQPVLHRQVQDVSGYFITDSGTKSFTVSEWPKEWTGEHLQIDDIWEPEPRRSVWPWFLLAGLLLVVVVGALVVLAARDGGLLP